MRIRALMVVSVTALALAGCKDSSAVGTNQFPVGDGVALQVPAGQRGEPIALKGPTVDGTQLDIASLRGQTVVLNVWGSWCGPCRKEASALVKAAAELAPQKVAFVGINTRDGDVAQAKSFEDTYKITYPSFFDQDGTLLLAFGRAVSPKAIPTTVVLDPQGRVAARFSGEITQQTLVDLVDDVTGSTPSPAASAASSPAPAPTPASAASTPAP